MAHSKRTLLAVSIAAVLTSITMMGCTEAPSGVQPTTSPSTTETTAVAVQTESQRLATFFQESFDEDVSSSPIWQSYLGIKDDYDKWDDVSDAATQAEIYKITARLAQSKTFDTSQLSAQEQLSLQIFQQDIERQLANDEFRHHVYIMHQFRAAHTFIPSFLINIHRINDISDADDYDIPLPLADRLWHGQYKGQKQKWMALRFTGNDEDININTAEPEFCEWRWLEPHELVNLAVPFKRDVYDDVLKAFADFV